MSPRICLTLLTAVAALAGCNAAAQGAPPPPSPTSHGERLASRNCASCHSLTQGAPSPLEDAPSFPQLRARYSAEDMAKILDLRMTEIHPRMPLLDMGPDEVSAFLSYWAAITPASKAKPPMAQPAAPIDMGRAIVTRDCGGCHSTSATGASAFPPAPPFRILGARYEIEGLSEALAEGISVGHPAMPEFVYPADQVAAIVAYLTSLQPKRAQIEKGVQK